MRTEGVKLLLMGVIFGWAFPILATAAVYVDPNNEFVVADSTADESKPRITVSMCG